MFKNLKRPEPVSSNILESNILEEIKNIKKMSPQSQIDYQNEMILSRMEEKSGEISRLLEKLQESSENPAYR